MFLFDIWVRARWTVLNPPHRRGSRGVFCFAIEISAIWRPDPGARYAPRGLLFGPCRRRGPWRVHGANPGNPAGRREAEPSAFGSAVPSHGI